MLPWSHSLHSDAVVTVVTVAVVTVEVEVVPQREKAVGHSYVPFFGIEHKLSIKLCLHAPDVPNLQPEHSLYDGPEPSSPSTFVVGMVVLAVGI